MTTLALFIAVLALVLATGTAWFCIRARRWIDAQSTAINDTGRTLRVVQANVDELLRRDAVCRSSSAHTDKRIDRVELSVRALEHGQKKPPAKKMAK